jgi:DNA-binding response OmpR family regulator
VLVVDDSAEVRERLVAMLEDVGGVSVQAAEGCGEAAAALARCPPDVAVLDVSLADGSGLDLLRAIRDAGLPTTVIILTNDPSPDMRARSAEAGADFFFDKSAEFERVIAIVGGRAAVRRRGGGVSRKPGTGRRGLSGAVVAGR